MKKKKSQKKANHNAMEPADEQMGELVLQELEIIEQPSKKDFKISKNKKHFKTWRKEQQSQTKNKTI